MKRPNQSTLIFILKGLLPYSRENIMLSFKPHAFFNEIEKRSGHPSRTISATYYRARKNGLISEGPLPRLTELGLQKVRPYLATKLKGGGKLMVIFDIPNQQNHLRRQFRNILKELGFKQIQQSVWMTSIDHRESVQLAINELYLDKYVQIYEAAKL